MFLTQISFRRIWKVDSLQSVLSSKDEAINSLEFQKLNDDSIVNLYALYIQKIKDNINEINKQELIINNKKIILILSTRIPPI